MGHSNIFAWAAAPCYLSLPFLPCSLFPVPIFWAPCALLPTAAEVESAAPPTADQQLLVLAQQGDDQGGHAVGVLAQRQPGACIQVPQADVAVVVACRGQRGAQRVI